MLATLATLAGVVAVAGGGVPTIDIGALLRTEDESGSSETCDDRRNRTIMQIGEA